MKTTLSLIALAFASCMTLSATAVAAEEDTIVKGENLSDYPAVKVKYNDLNLTTVDGEKALRHRIKRAATQLCMSGGFVDLAAHANGMRCRNDSIARAEPQVASVLDRIQNRDVASLAAPGTITLRRGAQTPSIGSNR
jgi:UrcA family protein